MSRFFHRPPRVPSTQEVEKCLALLDTADRCRDHVVVAMAAWTGLRVSELVALDWDQIVNGSGHIRHRVQLVPENTKGNVGGDVAVPQKLRWMLRQYRAWCARLELTIDGNKPVFVSRNSRRISVRRVQQVWKAIQAKAGIDPSYGFHGLRHYFGTQLYRTTQDIRLVQTAMRHRSISSTTVYTHISRAEVAAGVERAF